MYVTAAMIHRWEVRYGTPVVRTFAFEVLPRDIAMIRASQKHGRAHDITFFIRVGPPPERYVVIAKHNYPTGAYRAPGGGLHPGEDLESGLAREAAEETGLAVAPERYLLRARARFFHGDEAIDWTTHVFLCRTVDDQPRAELAPTDLHEIREARLVTLDELQGPIRAALLASGRPLFAYRVALTDAVVDALNALLPGE